MKQGFCSLSSEDFSSVSDISAQLLCPRADVLPLHYTTVEPSGPDDARARVFVHVLYINPSGGTLPSKEGQLPNWSLRLSVEAG